jgi:hypothetical protein
MCSRSAWLRENAVLGSASVTGVSRTRQMARRSPSMRRWRTMRTARHLQLQARRRALAAGIHSPRKGASRASPLSRLPIPRHPGPARKVSLAVRASCDGDAVSALRAISERSAVVRPDSRLARGSPLRARPKRHPCARRVARVWPANASLSHLSAPLWSVAFCGKCDIRLVSLVQPSCWVFPGLHQKRLDVTHPRHQRRPHLP